MDGLTVFILVPYIKCTMNGGSKSHSPGAEVREKRTIATPQGTGRVVGHFLQPESWLLRLHYCLISLELWNFSEILGGLGRKQVTKSQDWLILGKCLLQPQ